MKTEPLNFCRALKKSLIETGHAQRSLHLIHLIENSQKFILPPGGTLIDDPDLRALDKTGELNLPFPAIALEFLPCPSWRGATPTEVANKFIVFAYAESGSVHLDAYGFFASGGWDLFLSERYSETSWFDEDRRVFTGGRCTYDREVSGNLIHTLASFLNALSCSNVSSQQISDKRPHSRKGALPFDSYHVLVVPSGDRAFRNDGVSTEDRHAPREHVRRGHIRRYQSGLKIWVNSTVVNSGIGSKVEKTYAVRTPA